MNEIPKMGEFCWNELATPNLQVAKDFYGKVFGWEFIDHDMGEMVYTMIKRDGKEFGGIWSIPKDQAEEIPPHWMAYILVENVDKSLETAAKQGGTIVKPAANISDYGRFAIITDPTGAHVALWQVLRQK